MSPRLNSDRKLFGLLLLCALLVSMTGCSKKKNNAPEVEHQPVITVTEDVAAVIVLSDFASDADGDFLSFSIVQQPAHGVLSGVDSDGNVTEGCVDSDGNVSEGCVTYTPDLDYHDGPFLYDDFFVYAVSDGRASVDGAIHINIEAVNDPPVAMDDDATIDEDVPITLNVLANDDDIDGDLLTIIDLTVPPQSGDAVLLGNNLIQYIPYPDTNGMDWFTYQIIDPDGETDEAKVFITVNPVNDPPVAMDDDATIDEDDPITLNVLANDEDIDGDLLTIMDLTVPPQSGDAVLLGNNLIQYLPYPDTYGLDWFRYQIIDPDGETAEAKVFIWVNPVNDPPVAVDAMATTTATPTTAVTVKIFPLDNDFDVEMDELSITSFMQPNAGTVGLGPCDSLIYTPPYCNSDLIDSFTYEVSDGQGGTASATVTVDVLCAGFTFSGGDQDFNYDVTTGSLTTATGPFTVPLYLEDELAGGVTQDVSGFTMVLQHDPGLLEVTDVQLGAELINSGATICHSVVDDRVEILVDIPAGMTPANEPIIEVEYTTKPGGLRGNPLGLGSTLTWGPGSSVEIAGLEVETAGTEVALQFTPEGPASSDPIVVFYAPGQTVALNGNGTTTFDQSLYLEAHDANGSALPIDGFSMSLAHGPEVDVIDVAKGAALDSLRGGIDPEFFAWQDEADGFVVGVVVAYESVGSEVLLAPTGQDPVQVIDVILVTYEVVAGTGDSPLTWEDLGSPPVENVVTIEAVSYWPQLWNGSFFLVPAAGTSAIEDCDDGTDNDDDGLVDCDDPDCLAGFPLPPLGQCNEICNDGEDNDDDNLVDCDDPDCLNASICLGGGPELCDNGTDDDGDGLIDCDDPDCLNDPICLGGGPELCDNGTDDDGDGLIDCDDPDCLNNSVCQFPPVIGWTLNPDNCHLYRLTSGPLTIDDARAEAAALGGYLVSILDAEENTFIADNFNLGVGISSWIGLSDEINEGIWLWDSGEPFDYNDWRVNEPNNGGNGACEEDYVEFYVNASGNWNDISPSINPSTCPSDMHWGIIEVDSFPGWVQNPADCRLYRLTTGPMNITDARAEAAALGGYLVSIADQNENEFVRDNFSGPQQALTYCWIGLSDEINEGDWRWDSGEPFNLNSAQWIGGGPSGGTAENHVEMNTNPQGLPAANWGRWNDVGPNTIDKWGIIEMDI